MKIQQVAGLKVKGVLVSSASFQSGALTVSKSMGIALIRYFDDRNFKWVLNRSASAAARAPDADAAAHVEAGLGLQDYQSEYFDLYLQSTRRPTNSLWDFIRDLVEDSGLSKDEVRSVANSRARLASQVNVLKTGEVNTLTLSVLERIGYAGGEVSLADLCEAEHDRTGLRVIQENTRLVLPSSGEVLGSITFDPLEIRLYRSAQANYGRDRFTLAHELGHHLLEHSQYLVREHCQESDLVLTANQNIDATYIARMEWQANYFASCLLMPAKHLLEDFLAEVDRRDITNRGFRPLYVDEQEENKRNYYAVTDALKQKYGVSRTALRYRLMGMNLLTYERSTY